jgi:hypothetical protein
MAVIIKTDFELILPEPDTKSGFRGRGSYHPDMLLSSPNLKPISEITVINRLSK